MKLFQYIQGNRKGKEINQLEKEAMKDPFLADALAGFDKVTDNHELRIEELRAKVLYKTKSRKNHLVRYLSLAASILLIVGLGGYFLLNKNDTDAQINQSQSQIFPEQIVENEPLQENRLQDTTKQPDEPLLAEIKTKKKKEIPPVDAKKRHEVIESVELIESEAFLEIPAAQVLISDTVVLAETVPSKEGYESKNLVTDTDTMILAMKETTETLNEVVAYSTQKKTSVSVVPNENIKPEPLIGKKAYEKYLTENIIKPQTEGCKGKVKLKFSINQSGRPVNICVKKSLCSEADKEAIRLINNGPDWTVGNKDVEIDVKF
jgi:hypothetical protein